MEEYKLASKYFNKKNNSSSNNYIYSLINRILVSSLILVISLCLTKMNKDVKNFINEYVYNKNISFAKFNDFYEKIFGKVYPVVTTIKEEPVFNESFSYKEKNDYKDGVKLTVSNNYLMPALDSGIVVYIGDKDNYGHTIIVQQVNGIDLWYVGINNSNLKLYDYIEKGSLLGEATSNEIYLYYQKDGKFIDYKEYLG